MMPRNGVVCQLSYMQRIDIAHLDIRRENICMDYKSNRVILIDSDRWRKCVIRCNYSVVPLQVQS